MRLIDRILKGAGYSPMLCPPGTAAHEIIATEQPDIVMIDTWLEVRGIGWELIQTLRLDEATLHIPVLICSSDAEAIKTRIPKLAQQRNAWILAKPFDPADLLKTIAQILDGSPSS